MDNLLLNILNNIQYKMIYGQGCRFASTQSDINKFKNKCFKKYILTENEELKEY